MEEDPELKIEKQKNFLIKFCYWGVIITGIFLVFKYLGSILTPFILAFIIAAFLNIPVKYICNKTHAPRSLISILFVVLFYSIAILALTLVGAKIVIVLKDLFMSLPHYFTTKLEPIMWDSVQYFEKIVMSLDPNLISAIEESSTTLLNTLGDFVSKLSTSVVKYVSGFASAIPGIFLKTLIMIIVTFFITIDFEKITGFIRRQLPDNVNSALGEVKRYGSTTLIKCVLSYVFILFLTFTEISIGLFLIGVDNAVLIALIIAVFDILPVLGTGGIMIPWAIISLIYGNYKVGIGLILLYLFVTVVRNIVEPKIVGQQVGLHPVVTLISMFAGLNLFGFVGLFGFPIGLSILKYLNDKGTIQIFK